MSAINTESDSWGPTLPLPSAPPASGSAQAPRQQQQQRSSGLPGAGGYGLLGSDVRTMRPFSEDPVYQVSAAREFSTTTSTGSVTTAPQKGDATKGKAGSTGSKTQPPAKGGAASSADAGAASGRAASLPPPPPVPVTPLGASTSRGAVAPPPPPPTSAGDVPDVSKAASRTQSAPVPPATGQQQAKAGKKQASLGATPERAASRSGSVHRKRGPGFEEYLEAADVQSLVKTGAAYKGKLRINASDKSEAYVTVPGLPHDILVRGEQHQNRAFDGDEVVVEVLPVALWYRLYKLMPQDQQDLLNACKEYLETGGVSKRGGAKICATSLPDNLLTTYWCNEGSIDKAKAALSSAVGLAPPGALRITGRVVSIQEPSRKREHLVGVLQAGALNAEGEATIWLLPLDPTVAPCMVAPSNARALPQGLRNEAASPLEGPRAKRSLVAARVSRWEADSDQPLVEIRHSLGQAGEIESETAAILELYDVRTQEFSPEVLACLPRTPWTMRPDDMAGRRDFRSYRVFSIDPPTARDLDDALHITPVPERPGHWHVGVHIADVAHFIPPYSALDWEAGQRSTSVYMVQRVIPMLPRLLCEELCSLNPGVDRFAFSIEWELDAEGQVVAQWAGRSIIRSRAKLAYPMVQEMIEGVFQPEECSAALHDGETWDQVIHDCLALNQIATSRRQRRFDQLGALRLDNVKLTYHLDKDGNPVSVGQYRGAEANHLVEEYMLLANMQVAQLIATVWPERAMLRCHPPPNPRKLTDLQALSDQHVFQLDCSSAAGLQASLTALKQGDHDPQLVELIIQMVTRPMQLAMYFCTGEQPDKETWRHYALAVAEYTHFTSPIRRYPDIVVHRQLAAALQLHPQLSFSAPDYYAANQPGVIIPHLANRPAKQVGEDKEVVAQACRLFNTELTGKVALHCNERRLSARNAQDASLRLYLCVLLRRHPVVAEGIVSGVGGDRWFMVYLPAYGMEVRISLEDHTPLVEASWAAAAKTLLIRLTGSEAPEGQSVSRSNSLRRGDSQGQGKSWVSWMSDLPELNISAGLQPLFLPLQVRMFERVTVVLSSPLKLGGISQVEARLFLEPSALASAVPPAQADTLQQINSKVQAALAARPVSAEAQAVIDQAAAAAATIEAAQEGAEEFCIPYETMLND